MAQLPLGEPLPTDGKLVNPDVSTGFSAYIHIPFCETRCGYCDFNTYTNQNFGVGASVADYAQTVLKEIEFSYQVLSAQKSPGKLRSVFFGGGTPTLLATSQIAQIVEKLADTFGFAPHIEITTEANPETLTYEKLKFLQEAGINRFSFGMQSAVAQVLQCLDRTHTPGQVKRVTQWAKELGVNFSLDLIYGAPNETDADWEETLQSAISYAPNHISAYALTIEPNTKMGVDLAHGKIIAPAEDTLARRYERANEVFSAAGYQWYEISNWAKPGFECQHNLFYWKNQNWWGYGPGAHSHINGTRFWNVKHPRAYAARLALSPAQTPAFGHENLSALERSEEEIMLGIRLREGIAIPPAVQTQTIAKLLRDELIEPRAALSAQKLVLTLKGRLLADAVTRDLWLDLA